MTVEPRYHRTGFGQRMFDSRKARKLTQKQVCARIGIGQSTLAELEREAQSSGFTAMFAKLYAVDAHWLATGEIPMTVNEGQAHLMSYTRFDDPPVLGWEAIVNMKIKLPQRFVVLVQDDALAPLTPRGVRLIFDTDAAPSPGVGVLIEDAHGNRCIRRYVQAGGDRWIAAASNPAYAPLDSVKDELRVVAVASGRMDGAV